MNFGIRFYSVSRAKKASKGFADCLTELAALPLGQRFQSFDDKSSVRLERHRHEGDLAFGELIRCQNEDLPYLVPTADEPVRFVDIGGGQLGHSTAFCYHAPSATLAIQRGGGVSVVRMGAYLQKKLHVPAFIIKAKIREDAWERFLNRQPKFFEIKVAPYDASGSIDIEDSTMKDAIKDLKAAYGGGTFRLRIDIDSGEGDSALKPNALRWLLESSIPLVGKRKQVRSLRVGTVEGDDDDVINFLMDTIKAEYDVSLPNDDPDAHYAKREVLLKTAMKGTMRLDEG